MYDRPGILPGKKPLRPAVGISPPVDVAGGLEYFPHGLELIQQTLEYFPRGLELILKSLEHFPYELELIP